MWTMKKSWVVQSFETHIQKTKWIQRWRCSLLVKLCNILIDAFAENKSGTFENVLKRLLNISIFSWYEEKDTTIMEKHKEHSNPNEVKYRAQFEFSRSYFPCCPPLRWRGKLFSFFIPVIEVNWGHDLKNFFFIKQNVRSSNTFSTKNFSLAPNIDRDIGCQRVKNGTRTPCKYAIQTTSILSWEITENHKKYYWINFLHPPLCLFSNSIKHTKINWKALYLNFGKCPIFSLILY